MLFSYVTTLLGVGGLPLVLILLAIASGAFGVAPGRGDLAARMAHEQLARLAQPLRRLERASQNALLNSGPGGDRPTAGRQQPAAGRHHHAAGLVQGRPVVAVERIDTLDVPYVAPWLLFSVLHSGVARADLADSAALCPLHYCV